MVRQRRSKQMIEMLRKQIEDSNYWDARVKALDCNYFCDEVKLVFEGDGDDVAFHFEECYEIRVDHPLEYSKDIPYRELTTAQIPYFMQDVELNEMTVDKKTYLKFQINLYPITLYVVCARFRIS